MKLLNLNQKIIISTLKFVIVMPIALLFRYSKPNVWIITERPTQARDNGYCFFKYLKKEHPEEKVFYIIDKQADDYQKIMQYKNVIQFNSWKHYFYYCLSKVHISSHVNGCCPDYAISISRKLKKLIGFKDVFIPHGVSYGVSEFCLKKYSKIDLFICSGKQEYDNILNNYGYLEKEVAYTGFPRLDNWHNNDIIVNPRQIVMMPTWRVYLVQEKNIIFEDTAYYKVYKSVLDNSILSNFLIKNNLKLIFYLHSEMRKYVNLFKTSCPNIEVVYKDSTYDIQELLKTSALLITDYSSVHFDFAYMNKPIIYFQFDKEEFFCKQYQRNWFEAEINGFGPVVDNVKELVEQIEKAYKKQFRLTEPYHSRMRLFYQIHDTHNCERVYQEIIERIL